MIWKKQPVGSKLADLQNNKASKDAATQSTAGLMSAADKTKLDGVATGATAVPVVNDLNSDSTTSALSAAQGKALNSKITKIHTTINVSNGYASISNPAIKTTSAMVAQIHRNGDTDYGWENLAAYVRCITDGSGDITIRKFDMSTLFTGKIEISVIIINE